MSGAEADALRAAVQTLVAALDIDAIALAAQLPAQVWAFVFRELFHVFSSQFPFQLWKKIVLGILNF